MAQGGLLAVTTADSIIRRSAPSSPSPVDTNRESLSYSRIAQSTENLSLSNHPQPSTVPLTFHRPLLQPRPFSGWTAPSATTTTTVIDHSPSPPHTSQPLTLPPLSSISESNRQKIRKKKVFFSFVKLSSHCSD